jgi:hypothetical protein
MANGNGRRDRLLELLRQGGEGMIGPIELDSATRDTTRVIDGTRRSPMLDDRGQFQTPFRSIGQGTGALRQGFQTTGNVFRNLAQPRTPTQPTQPAAPAQQPAQQPADMGLNAQGIPNALARRDQPADIGGQPQADPLADMLRTGGIGQAEMPASPTTRTAEQAITDFAGSQIENVTPVGVPEPEEITGLGRALSQFGKALETPGFQRFLSEMGIAFSGGHPNTAGTILGQQNIQSLDAQAQSEVMQRLLAGESLEDIDLSQIRTMEGVQAATDVAVRRGEFEQTMEQRQAEQEFDQDFRTERLRQFDDQIGIQRDRLELDWFRALSDQSATEKPDGVASFEHGYALSTVASTDVFHNAAMQSLRSRADELGLSTIQDIQSVLRGDDGQLDPHAVRANIPSELQQEFDRQVNQLSQSVSRSFRDIDSPADLDFRPGLAQPASLEEASQLDVGSLFVLPDGGTAIRTEGGFRRITGVTQE